MDMRYEMHNMLREYGRQVLIVRRKHKVACRCVVDGIPNKSCNTCLGTGYLYKADKVFSRDKGAASAEGLPRLIRDSEFGDLAVPSRMYYLEYDIRPDINDYIVDCEWVDGKPVMDNYSGVYEINTPEPFRGDQGRIEYFRAACKYDPVVVSGMKAYAIKRISGTTYHVAIGGQ